MEPVGSRYERLIYAYEFPDNSVYVGLTYNLDKRDKSHMSKDNSAVFKHMLNTGLKPVRKTLTAFLNKDEASKLEGQMEKKYRDEGWTILNRSKTGTLGGGIRKWTDDKIKTEILKYTTLNDFYKNSRSAFNAAKNRGDDFFNEIVKNLDRKIEYSTDEQLRNRAKLYKTKSEFMKNDISSYSKSRRRGDDFFNSITSHMIPIRKKWTEENLKSEALKYQSKKSFHNGSPSAYNAAKTKGDEFFNNITKHMGDKRIKDNM
jgi:predicted GIY-YIG superfamily endonuclease